MSEDYEPGGADGLAGLGQQIERLTKESARASALTVPGERPGIYYLIGPDGKAEKHDANEDPGYHKEKLATPGELRDFVAKNYGAAEDDSNPASKLRATVFYNENGLIFVYDANDRRDVATCALRHTPQFQWLNAFGGKPLDQKSFVRALRIDLRGCFPGGSNLLNLVRNLKFNSAGESGGNIQHGRESLGKSVMAQVTGEDAFPEEVALEVQVYQEHSFRTGVVCALEIFPDVQRFALTPYPGELEKAVNGALEAIAAPFDDEVLPPVYRGSPA